MGYVYSAKISNFTLAVGGARYSNTLKGKVKKFLDAIGINSNVRGKIRAFLPFLKHSKPFIENVNSTTYTKKCLLVYITAPFIVKKISDSHQNQPQAVEMARVIGEFGYNVDVIMYTLKNPGEYLKDRTYDFIVGLIPRGLDFWTGHMNPSCKIAAYMTSMNLAVTYQTEVKRIDELEQRKGVRLKVRNGSPDYFLTKDLESFDAAWFIGNQYNLRSYDCFNMPPVYFIRNTGYNFSWLNKDIIRDKRNFLFFASGGQVHKGLDLLLDIFSEDGFPCNLYICSSFMNEEDFCQLYHHELNKCPNIFPVGFVDINGAVFREITEKCAFMIMPSCSEGCAGSVLTAMSAGLIPIISRECGIDGEIDDGVIQILDCKIDTIRKYILECSQKPDDWIKEHSALSVKTATTTYSFESFTRSVREAMSKTIGGGK